MSNDGVQAHYKGGKKNRQTRSLIRLQAQLASGKKSVTIKNFAGIKSNIQAPLEDSDVDRINKEIATLKSSLRLQ